MSREPRYYQRQESGRASGRSSPKLELTHSVQLARAAQEGDREALDQLFRRYHEQVRRIARIRMGRKIRSRMDSGDLVQNTYIVAMRKIQGFEPRSHGGIIQWLSKILENQIRDAARELRADRRDVDREVALRDLAGERSESSVHPVAGGRIPSEEVSDAELTEIYDTCVGELEGDYREVILLRDYALMEWQKITAELDVRVPVRRNSSISALASNSVCCSVGVSISSRVSLMSKERPNAEDILAEWIELVSTDGGESFEALLERYPREAPELSRLHAHWAKLQSVDRRVQPEEFWSDAKEDDSDRYRGNQSLGAGADGLQPGARLGQYELEHELGRGGMGVVWSARDLMLGERVALKFLPHILVSDRLAMLRLRREAKVLLALTHLGIVRLRTVEAKHGLTFLVEECLGGPTLEEVVHERVRDGERGLSAEEALWVLDEVAPALEYAHAEGVTHRDLKPSNLMLDIVPDGELGEGAEHTKLTDFGLAFVATSALSQISGYRPTGTLPYMAPEVLMGRKPTPAADVYGLGATIYHLVAGEPPFAHGDIATQILHRQAEPLSSGNDQLDAAIKAAMEKNPADRPETVDEFVAMAFGELSPRGDAPLSRFDRGGGGRVYRTRLLILVGAVEERSFDHRARARVRDRAGKQS